MIYAILGFQLLRARLKFVKLDRAGSISDAFHILEGAVVKSMPAMQRGFTWREALAEVRRHDLGVDWSKVDKAVAEYEGYRYGGVETINPEYGEILLLARRLGV